MSITYLKMDFVGEQGVNPRIGRMISTDDYNTVTEDNYINNYANSLNISLESTDIIAATYSGGREFFNVVISGDNITLQSQTSPGGNVTSTLPTTADNIPFWDNTAGKLDSDGYVPSSIGADFVCMVEGSTLVNTLPRFNNTTGTIEATDVQPSDYNQPKIASVDGATIVGHASTFSDVLGTIEDSGQRMPFATLASGGAGSATLVFTVTGAALADPCWFSADTIVNPVSVISCTATDTDEVTVVFSGDTGGVVGHVWIQKSP